MDYMDLPPVERMVRRRPRVVIVGAGFGGLTLTRRLASVPVDVTLIDRNNYHLFTPLIYQVATATLSPTDIAQSVRGTFRSRISTLVNWAWAYLLGEPAARIDVRASEPLVVGRYESA